MFDCKRKLGGTRQRALVAITFSLALPPYASSQLSPSPSPPASARTTGLRATFEVATVKPSDPSNTHQSISLAGNSFNATTTLKSLIERAYEVRDFQVLGSPKWLDSEKFDVAAKSDETQDLNKLTPAEQDIYINRQMERLQSLLAERFHLQVHKSEKQMAIYSLVVTKDGPKLKPPGANEQHRLYSQAPGQLACFSASMAELADELGDQGIDRIVFDKTGLTGNYDFHLHWAPNDAPAADPAGPSIFTALQEQLGLKLEPARGPVEVLVIDHVDRLPTEN